MCCAAITYYNAFAFIQADTDRWGEMRTDLYYSRETLFIKYTASSNGDITKCSAKNIAYTLHFVIHTHAL